MRELAEGESPNDHFVGRRDVTRWATPVGRALADAHHRLSKRTGSRRALVLTLVAGGSVAAVATFAAARIYDGVADSNGIEALDGPILKAAMNLRSPALDAAAASIARIFGPIGMPVLTLAAGALLAARGKSLTPLTLLGAAGLGSLAMTLSGKDIIHRHRPPRGDAIPPYESSPSFPSGHTLNATTIAGVLAYLIALRQRRQLPQMLVFATAVATAGGVGLSRVLLGAHWFSDVLVGWVTGTGWVAIVITSHRLYPTNRSDQGNS